MFGGVPGAALLNATSQMDIRFLPLSQEVQSAVNAGNEHFLKVELSAGAYRGQDDAIRTIGTEVLFVGAEEVSAETIREISDILYAHPDELISIMPLMQFFTPDNPLSLQEPAIPRHDGYTKYLMENGDL